MASLADLYRFDDREAVTGFISRHDFLVELLIEAREHIRTHFGPDTPAALEVFHDLDDEQGEPDPPRPDRDHPATRRSLDALGPPRRDMVA